MKTYNYFEKINIVLGDITEMNTDAIVNAANNTLAGGGGVDGAIHRAAGYELLAECLSLKGCNTGEAKITKGYRLKTKFIIHTVGPVYKNGKYDEANLLTSAYKNCMCLAKQHNIKSIAFPAISTGVYNFPKEEACTIAINTVIDFMENNGFTPEVYFVLFDTENYNIYKHNIERFNEFPRKT